MLFFHYIIFGSIHAVHTLGLVLLRPKYWSSFWRWSQFAVPMRSTDFEESLFRLSGRYQEDELNPVSTPLSVAYEMLEQAAVDPQSIVVDLGAGRGAFMMAALFHEVSMAYGVEVQSHLLLSLKRIFESSSRLKWIHADVRDIVMPEGTHYIVSWTTWNKACRKAIESILNRLPAGTKVWVWTHELNDPGWELLRHRKLSLPGYRLEVFLYEKG